MRAFLAKVNAAIAEAERLTRRRARTAPRRGSTSAPPTACGRSSASSASSGWRRPATASASRNRSSGRSRSIRRCTTPSSASACIATTPASRRRILRFLRFLLLLPGGDRADGLRQLERAATRGVLVRGEAQYQIHVLYLWYEQKWPQALEIVRGLQAALSAQPAFRQIEAEILDVYFHDAAASLDGLGAAARAARTRRGRSRRHRRRGGAPQHRAAVDRAEAARARRRAARSADRTQPRAPSGALARARALRRTLR